MKNRTVYWIFIGILVLAFAISAWNPTTQPETSTIKDVQSADDLETADDDSNAQVPGKNPKLPEADMVINGVEDSGTYSSPNGEIITKVDVRLGSEIHTFTQDTADSCLEISGIGTDTVEVNKIGNGKDCRGLNRIGLYFGTEEEQDEGGRYNVPEPTIMPAEPPSTRGRALQDADVVIDEDKTEITDTNSFTTPEGQTIAEVVIKAGQGIFSFTEDSNDGCYEVIGIGTGSVQVNRLREGRDCKEIGSIGIFYGEQE